MQTKGSSRSWWGIWANLSNQWSKSFKVVVDTNIPSNLCLVSRKVDIIELPRQYSMSQSDKMGDNIEDKDEDKEFDDNVETESDDHSPQRSY